MRCFLLMLVLLLGAANTYAPDVLKQINFNDGCRFHRGLAGDPQKDVDFGLATIFSKLGKAGGMASYIGPLKKYCPVSEAAPK